MKDSLFISYSRQETPFVSHLFRELKNADHETWLDFHHLVPAEKWEEHIARAIGNSQVFLLSVSVESIKSKNVEYEWRRAIEFGKRIVLVIFEATELPPELINCEWIDFRTSFRKGVKTLLVQLEYPGFQNTPPPQSGFKTSPTVWIAFSISLLISLIALFNFWTISIPYHLFPLPYRILKRNFIFFDVQGVLLILPVMTFLSYGFASVFVADDSISFDILVIAFLSSLLAAPLMLVLLRLPGMRRWGKPMASVPIFAHRYSPPKAINVRPMKVMLDFAAEDRRYARTIMRQLNRHGHQIVTDESSAEAIIVLMSNFKKTTAYNPEESVIFPVLLQDISNIDAKLAPIQWIDFRRGLRNLKHFCMLLPNPTKMLNALGIVPMGRQVVLPPLIQVLVYFLTLLVGLMVGGAGLFTVALGSHMESSGEVIAIVFMFITILAAAFLAVSARQSLLSRQGRLATFRNLTLGLVGLVFLWIVQLSIATVSAPAWDNELPLADRINATAGVVQILLTLLFLVGLAMCIALCLWYWKDFYRWIPCKKK
ncbi:MAG: toll/interleukin-1 receptor domain-containing protein [Leptolyngbyaceae cyanobacterium MO_188.B28]|nr:toll/interleukin-1 receptor domain-containing protein [Leptolyngbyaceae cyanobacterium MO_188.B28]